VMSSLELELGCGKGNWSRPSYWGKVRYSIWVCLFFSGAPELPSSFDTISILGEVVERSDHQSLSFVVLQL